MQAHLIDGLLQASCLRTLWSMLLQRPSLVQELMSPPVNVHTHVLSSLRCHRHAECPDVAEFGCQVLLCLASFAPMSLDKQLTEEPLFAHKTVASLYPVFADSPAAREVVVELLNTFAHLASTLSLAGKYPPSVYPPTPAATIIATINSLKDAPMVTVDHTGHGH